MFRFAICNELYRDWPYAQMAAHARECGYEGLEIAPHTLGPEEQRFSTQRIDELRQAANDNGLAIVGLHWLLAETQGLHWTSDDKQVRLRTAEYLARLIDLCSALGGRIMVLGSPRQRDLSPNVSLNRGLEYAVEVVERLLPRLANQQICLAVEPLGPQETNFLNTAAETSSFIRRFDSPWIRLHLDVKAMSSESIPIPQIIATHRGELAHFHANDPNRRGPGMGPVDFVPILRALADAEYRGWVSVEVFDETPGIERLARESIHNLRRDCAATLQSPQ
jgi:sugar phosphate isomerase/epimerase